LSAFTEFDESLLLGLLSLLRTLASLNHSESLDLLAGKTLGIGLSLNGACLKNRTAWAVQVR
jgi:hypothetical protein